mmetsp:Transcript_126778/g.364630  ORF Transcript_126778/g.364630 Transcript_126778/m.364630 type:complete len:397 (-) Transcript_126778:244-1434(-)
MQLRWVHLADRAGDEEIRLVARAIALRMQPLEARLAHAVAALGAIARGGQGAFDAIDLPRAAVQLLGRVRLVGQVAGDILLRALIVDDLDAPLHLLRVQLALVVHLGEGLEEGLQCAHHVGLVDEIDAQNVPQELHVLGRHQGHLTGQVGLGLRLVGPQDSVDPQLDVLLVRRTPAMVKKLRKVVVERMLPRRLVRLVVQVAHDGADALETRPGLRQLHLGEAFHDPSVGLVALLVRVEVCEPLLDARSLPHAPQHGHNAGLLNGSLGRWVRDAEEPKRVCIQEIQCSLGQLLALLQSLERFDPQGVDVVGPRQLHGEGGHVAAVGVCPRVHHLVLRAGAALARVEVHHLVVDRNAGGEARWDGAAMQVLGLLWVRQVHEGVHFRHLLVDQHAVAI